MHFFSVFIFYCSLFLELVVVEEEEDEEKDVGLVVVVEESGGGGSFVVQVDHKCLRV